MKDNKLYLFNTLSKSKEEFIPIKEDEVGFYSCGPTVYSYAHIGNLRSFIFADTLKRILKFNGYKVKHVMNITDVGHLTSDADEGEDKLEKGASREGKTVWELAEFYTKAFKKDLEKLNVEPPSIWSKATDHIEQQIAMIKKLEANGFTYKTSTGVYYDTSKFSDYGKLANLKIEELKAGARIEVDTEKKNPRDFLLWAFTVGKNKNHIMNWDSPWGNGFPGWHIECSSMSSHYLGERFDIHTGGMDLIPVHHTNEIAQAEGAFGHKWVNYWMHNEFLVIGNNERMAKSDGNFLTLTKLEKDGFPPMTYRYFCLNGHYRQQLQFSDEAMISSKNAYQRLKNKVKEILDNIDESKRDEQFEQEFIEEFTKAVNDDLNTPKALGLLWQALRKDDLPNYSKMTILELVDPVLGLRVLEKDEVIVPDEVLELVEARAEAKKDKDWAKADSLRDKIEKKGFVVKDNKDGSYSVEKE